MNKRFLDALENVLICLLLISSYLGFFFVVSSCLILAGVQFTKLIIVLVFLCSCGITHLLFRLICGVQQKVNFIRWKEKNRNRKIGEDE